MSKRYTYILSIDSFSFVYFFLLSSSLSLSSNIPKRIHQSENILYDFSFWIISYFFEFMYDDRNRKKNSYENDPIRKLKILLLSLTDNIEFIFSYSSLMWCVGESYGFLCMGAAIICEHLKHLKTSYARKMWMKFSLIKIDMNMYRVF